MTKHSFLFLLLCISFSLSAQSTWQQTSGPEGCSLFDIERNSTTVFAATTNGLWQSTDEGATWSLNNAQMFDQSVDALYVSNNELLVLSVEFNPNYEVTHHFYRSTDGGVTWAYHELTGDIGYGLSEDEIEMWRDGAIIWITDRYDNCFKSLDNGDTWTEVVFPQGFYSNFIAAHGDKIFVFGYFSTLRSEDGGITWIETADTTSLNDVYFEGDLIMYTDGDSISVSQDFGITWQTAPFDSYTLGGVKRGDDGFLYRFYNNIFRSADGLTWTPVTQFTTYNYFSTGVQSGAAFIVGGNGMYKTVNNNTQILPSQSGLLNAGCKSVASMASGRLIVSIQSNGGTWSTYNKGLNWSKLDNPGAHPYNQVSFNTMTAQGDTVWGVGSNDTLYRIIGNATTWEKTIDCNSWYTGETFVRIIDSVVYLVESEQIRRSFDHGATWEVLLTVTNNNDFRGIAKVGNYLFYSTNNGIVFRSADNGLTWENNYEIWSPGAHRLNALTTQNDVLFLWNEDEAFYTVDYGASWIQMGFNGLPVNSWDEPYFEAVDIKHYGNAILVTIPYNGVWITFNFGNNWAPLNDGLTNKRGRYMAISDNDIFLASSTSSVWRLGANFEVFTGNIYNDLNNNGQKDAGEGPLANRIVGAEPLGSYTTSNNGGIYSLVAAAELDTIRMQPPNNYCTISPLFHAATQPNNNYDFGVHFTEGIVDLSIDMVNWEPFRPGFDNKITLTVQNIGNETVQNAQVIAVLPSTLSIDWITPSGLATVSNDTIFWSIASIEPFASMSIQIEVTLSVNEPIGSTLSLYGHVEATNDVDETNNEISLREIVVGSYDPNDKYAVDGITPQAVVDGTPIDYIIRFENTGTFYAEKVVVTDVLDKNLNPATFQFLSSSHPCQWRITADGKLEFTFNDIFLEVNETGFIKFSIEADRSLELNDIVSNTAEIYFDFNAPIITNTVETTVKTSVSTHTPYLSNINIELSPNPAKNILNATVSSDMVKNGQVWEITDASGKVLLRERQRSETTSFAIASLPNGIYEVVLRNRNATVIGSKTVVVAH